MKQQSRVKFLWLCLFLWIACGSINGGDDLTQECSEVVQKVIPCLDFAAGKEATPKKECCDAATVIKDTKPQCLCFIIQETHKGSPSIKNLGIQEAKLLQLPDACHVKNASVANCPKLLGLPPSSPDAAIFTNSSKATPASATPQGTSQSQNSSYGSMVRPGMVMDVMMVTLAIVLIAIPTGFMSIYT
ncbi:non-specific lipid transfer protein GPI-anchored 1-like [Abrus precatorius]|uniref:Non-specific lipid transfer protein GPI-anchored 1-like n=1 Tax=Abrus precatorius TaxID=3816 RepID=A0A8B8K0K7_ABRPR|nr:non-specific lipid transfer protein GPI-anchored 1-like [Abrus precatorius]